ncbi:hypothetical protein P7K49_002347 [Saguinus oedipus]|uniref:Uncharacterized protein n=1 Tax=Saguinus oedipus TaxID=9490 RepID=A0ABQ9WH30_SAGOE|nr:hypothetical protein P7K49_002347 [Saguinus oedipus]
MEQAPGMRYQPPGEQAGGCEVRLCQRRHEFHQKTVPEKKAAVTLSAGDSPRHQEFILCLLDLPVVDHGAKLPTMEANPVNQDSEPNRLYKKQISGDRVSKYKEEPLLSSREGISQSDCWEQAVKSQARVCVLSSLDSQLSPQQGPWLKGGCVAERSHLKLRPVRYRFGL